MAVSRLFSVLSRLNSRAELRKIIANTGWLFVDQFFGLVAGVLVGAWVARYLGPAQYGLYNYVLAFGALFAPIAGLGLAGIVVREIVRSPENKDVALGTAFFLQFVASFLTVAVIIGAGYLIQPDDNLTRWLIEIVAFGLVFQAFSSVVGYWFQSLTQSKYMVWPRNVALLSITLVKIVLILMKAPLIAFVWITLAQSILFTVGIFVVYHLSGQKISAWRFNYLYAGKLLRDSWPLIFAGLAVVMYMKIDQLMLKSMVGDKSLGIYSAAVRLSELWYFLPVALSASVFPVIVRSRESQVEQVYRQRLQMFYDIMVSIAYIIAIPLAIFSSPFVFLFFGSAYSDAGPILSVHIWAFIFVSLGVARSQWLIAENMTWFSMFSTILGAVVNVGLNLWLIPKHAGLGAAWATLISYAVSAYLSSLFMVRTRTSFKQLSLSLLIPFRLGSLGRALRENT